MGRVLARGPETHADGEIWVEALWEARANLIRQFGEKEGRRRIRLLVIDGMKLSPPAPSMVDARDAILLADRADFKGQSQQQLWAAFAKRGLGVLAQSTSPNSVHISSSFDTPSNTGVLKFYEKQYSLGENVRLALYDRNNPNSTALVQLTASSGDIENVVMRKKGEVFYGDIQSYTDGFSARGDSALDLVPGDYISAYYFDADSASGAKLIQTTVPTKTEYVYSEQSASRQVTPSNERSLYPQPPGFVRLGNTRLQLPFAFPFFGESYRTINVSGDGLLSFDIPNLSACNDAGSFANAKVIAPLWMEILYDGGSQLSGNVFYGTGPDYVTFRWAGRTLQTFEPVNATAVLYDDGRIQFQYGDGNNNLVNSSIFGCSTKTPAIGISPGHGTYTVRVEDYDGSPSLEDLPPVLFEPPFNYSSEPVVVLESPSLNDAFQGVLTVKGIAHDPNSSIARLDVLIDGVPQRRFVPTVPRPDFCAAQNVPDCPIAGFSTTLDFTRLRLAPGRHTVQILATNTRGAFKRFPEEPVAVSIQPGQSRTPMGAIERPAAASSITGVTQIRGYVYASDLRIVSVDILIDGVTYGNANYGQRRDDICGPISNQSPNCPNVGFTFNLNSAAAQVQLPNGEHTLQGRALDEAGRYTLFPEVPVSFAVDNVSNQGPVGKLTSPALNARLSGTITIEGYAYDPDGTVRTVDLIVDGSTYQSLRYGLPRPEACAALPDVKACPNIGFSGEFDTTQLSNGIHRLGVVLRDNQGRFTILPDTTLVGGNVTVQN